MWADVAMDTLMLGGFPWGLCVVGLGLGKGMGRTADRGPDRGGPTSHASKISALQPHKKNLKAIPFRPPSSLSCHPGSPALDPLVSCLAVKYQAAKAPQ